VASVPIPTAAPATNAQTAGGAPQTGTPNAALTADADNQNTIDDVW
jgi:hypothetical protein